jgi:CubicO group peptidase (beta-lactamase class C family)
MTAESDWKDCITFAQAHEVGWPRDPAADPSGWGVHHEDPAPFNRLRGPVHPRGGVSGVVWQHGRELLAWGEPDRADLTFSVAKTCLALLAGVAQLQGLLPDVDAPVRQRLPGLGFDSAHNCLVTWRHLLEQTSEWEGSCFGLPDTVDRWRKVQHDPRPAAGPKGGARPLQPPGSYWEYNDVRINQLSLALLHLFGEPLPEVFARSLMQPLGASDSWAWRGYDDAWVTLGGRRMPSVPGGTHWGAGLSISARDMARLGQLLLADGTHAGRALLPAGWARQMRTAQVRTPFYGWLLWLNPQGLTFPGASAASQFMMGAGGHTVWVEPAHDAVVVVRWLDGAALEGFMARASVALATTA